MNFHPDKNVLLLWQIRLLLMWIPVCFLCGVLSFLRSVFFLVPAVLLLLSYLAISLVYLPACLHRISFVFSSKRAEYRAGLIFRREILLELSHVFSITQSQTPLQKYFRLYTAILYPPGSAVRFRCLTHSQFSFLLETWRACHE